MIILDRKSGNIRIHLLASEEDTNALDTSFRFYLDDRDPENTKVDFIESLDHAYSENVKMELVKEDGQCATFENRTFSWKTKSSEVLEDQKMVLTKDEITTLLVILKTLVFCSDCG